jgi:hypothetical protein
MTTATKHGSAGALVRSTIEIEGRAVRFVRKYACVTRRHEPADGCVPWSSGARMGREPPVRLPAG